MQLLCRACDTSIKPMNMPPGEQYTQFNALYQEFTVAYINVHVVRREFYLNAKKFVEQTEPELTVSVEKISKSENYQANPFAYQTLVNYLNQFDDFTLTTNKMFSDLQIVLDKSDAYMNKLVERKIDVKNPAPEPETVYSELIPELNELTTGLKKIGDWATSLETKMNAMQNTWAKTRDAIN